MGLLVDGKWRDSWYDTDKNDGRFERSKAQFRNWVTRDGSPGPSGDGGFKAEPGRYHLYVSLACPWAHRTLIFRRLKRLEAQIGISVVNWFMGKQGWSFEPGPGVIADPIGAASRMYEVYLKADPRYSGRVTVPVLWDTQRGTVVSNESADIIRMLNSAFDEIGAAPCDYYPESLRASIDEINDRVYEHVNNGVYKAGFATTQAAYEEAVLPLFDTLDWLEHRLATRRYLCGERLTEADWRLFTTLIRFDPVYVGHFKCNLRRIADYPNLSGYLRELYQIDGVAGTVNFEHIKGHYYQSHDMINPSGIVAKGPLMDLEAPHGRGHLPCCAVSNSPLRRSE